MRTYNIPYSTKAIGILRLACERYNANFSVDVNENVSITAKTENRFNKIEQMLKKYKII